MLNLMIQDYWGHVFWDQDTWMYPSVLVLHADLGKILINTRRRTMHGAAENAKAFQCDGLKFPWESAFTGMDVWHCTPKNQHWFY